MSTDGLDFTAEGSGVVFLERGREVARVLKVYFYPLSEEATEYGFAVKDFDYPAYLKQGSIYSAEEFASGPGTGLVVQADPKLMDDMIDYSKGKYGKPGIFYIEMNGEVTWTFSPHPIERDG